MRLPLLLLCLLSLAVRAADRPNVLFILTDDQGYGDISAHGNPVLKTPNIDKLRSESVRFEDFHVSPTCAPTRSALLTGRHEFRNGITHTIFERERLALGAATLTQQLQKAGYRTGIFGKWHLGDEAEYQPERRGFDEVFIHGGGGIGQSYPGSCGDAPGNTYFNPTMRHNGKFEKTEGFCTDVIFARATQWVEQEAAAKRPFYAYIATNAPHAPYTAKPEDAARFVGKVPAGTEGFFGMIENIDQNVGRLLARLTELGLDKNTLVVFMNDNGSASGMKVFSAGMRGAKGTAYLGGTRAMSFWRLPGSFAPHAVQALAAHIDFAPTILEITGTPSSEPMRAQVEGRSLVPLLKDAGASWPERTLVTHVGRWNRGTDPETGKYRQVSVRTTRWHLVSELPANVSGKAKGKGATLQWMLYDLSKDYAETTDVGAEHPEVVAELKAHFESWWKDVRPMMVNEFVVGPAENPYKVWYEQQMGVR